MRIARDLKYGGKITDEAHDGNAGTDQGYVYRIVHIRPAVLQEILGGSPLPFLDDGVTTDPALHAAVSAILHDPGTPQESLVHEDQVLDLALALQSAFGSGRRHVGDPRAARLARDFIDDEPRRRIDLDSLSRASGRDRWSLSRDFRHFFGTSPSRYMTMRRLDLARQMMSAGTPLAECAASSGFADQSHMTRQFVHAFGLTPSRWLNLQLVVPHA